MQRAPNAASQGRDSHMKHVAPPAASTSPGPLFIIAFLRRAVSTYRCCGTPQLRVERCTNFCVASAVMATPMMTPGMTPGGSVGGSGMFGGGVQRLPPEVNRILYIRNLPFNITPEEMYKIFGDYGAVRQIRMCAPSVSWQPAMSLLDAGRCCVPARFGDGKPSNSGGSCYLA